MWINAQCFLVARVYFIWLISLNILIWSAGLQLRKQKEIKELTQVYMAISVKTESNSLSIVLFTTPYQLFTNINPSSPSSILFRGLIQIYCQE